MFSNEEFGFRVKNHVVPDQMASGSTLFSKNRINLGSAYVNGVIIYSSK